MIVSRPFIAARKLGESVAGDADPCGKFVEGVDGVAVPSGLRRDEPMSFPASPKNGGGVSSPSVVLVGGVFSSGSVAGAALPGEGDPS
jgi:hypothetical protein